MTGTLARRAVIVIAVVALAAMSTLIVRAQQLDVETESAVIARLAATTGAVETLAGQAIVFGLDADAGIVEQAQGSAGLAALEVALDDLRRLETTAATGPGVREFILAADRVTSDLLAGNLTGARMRFSADLVGARTSLDGVVSDRIAELAADALRLDSMSRRLAWTSIVAALVGLVWASAPLGGWMGSAVRARRGRHEVVTEVAVAGLPGAQERIVIQLPDEPNDLPMRRRNPRVEDLGWLLEQILAPFDRTGWVVDVSCPAVGVDCDPADLREMVGSVLRRADSAGAERIGVAVRTSRDRVRITVADDGASVFGEDGNAMGHGPVSLRSAVRTRAEAVGATLTWRRSDGLNLATLELPRLARSRVAAPA